MPTPTLPQKGDAQSLPQDTDPWVDLLLEHLDLQQEMIRLQKALRQANLLIEDLLADPYIQCTFR